MAPNTQIITADALAAMEQQQLSQFKTTELNRPVPYAVDLGNLYVYDPIPLDAKKFGDAKEDYIRSITRDGVQALVNQLWKQPIKASADSTSILAELPAPSTPLPREKPIPKAKPMTRWEKFAKEKGIKKTKKSRKVFDEETKEWIPAWGYQGANNKEDWVKEVPAGADPYEDQFEKAREEKVERVSKNKRQQQRNLEKNGMAADKTNAGGFSTLAARNNDVRQKRKMELQETIKTVRGSTASLGRFDKKIESEEKIVKFAGEKRKFDDNIADLSKERQQRSKILKKIVEAQPLVDMQKGTGKAMSELERTDSGPSSFKKKKFSKKSSGPAAGSKKGKPQKSKTTKRK